MLLLEINLCLLLIKKDLLKLKEFFKERKNNQNATYRKGVGQREATFDRPIALTGQRGQYSY